MRMNVVNACLYIQRQSNNFELSSTCIRVYLIVLSRVLRTLNVCESCYVVCPDFKCKYLVCTPTNDSSSKQPNHVYYRWSSERKQQTNTSYATRYQEIFKHKL